MIEQRVKQYIDSEQLLIPRAKVLVALSGGADSVALLHILLKLGFTCEAAHCNFQLRGEESDRDELFVKLLCKEHQVGLHKITFQTHTYAKSHGISIEMAARELRYHWFEELAQEYHFNAVAIAHHQDDSVETMLLNLIRGTGINGLLGIKPKNGIIVRPLLCLSRQEIVGYLKQKGQNYVTDSTNLQDEYTRNKIRLQLLPMMSKINPSIRKNLIETARNLRGVAAVYQHEIAHWKEKVCTEEGLLISTLLESPSPETLLFEILYPLGFNPPQIEEIFTSLQGEPGRQFFNTHGWRAVKDRERLLLIHADEEKIFPQPPQLSYEEYIYSTDFTFKKEKHIAYFDADKLDGAFSVRKWIHGDRFVPFGMKGSKLVSDYLTDRKFSVLQKEQQWVLCCGTKIAWLIGERSDERFRVDEKTKKVVVVKAKSIKEKTNK